MPEKLLSSKTAAEKQADLAAVQKATGVNYTTQSERPINQSGSNQKGPYPGQLQMPSTKNTEKIPGGSIYTDPKTGAQTFLKEASSSGLQYPDPVKNITPGENGESVYTDPKTGQKTNLKPASSGVQADTSSPSAGASNINPQNSAINNSSVSRNIASPAQQPTVTQPKMARTLETPQQSEQPMAESQYDINPTDYGFREDALNSVGQDFFRGLGAHSDFVKKAIAEYEQKTGTSVAMNSRAFQSQLRKSLGNEKSWDPIFKRFAHQETFPTTSTPAESLATDTARASLVPMVDADQTPEDQIATILNDTGSQTLHAQLDQILSMPAETPGETLVRNQLMLQLGIIDNTYIDEILTGQEQRALQKYSEGLAMVKKGSDEIDKAIDGTLGTPDTSAGLLAKIYKEGEEAQLAANKEEIDYENKRHDIIMADMRAKRADLQGYAKAKLYSMGAEDSSAGIALMSKIVSEADMQISLAELDHTHGMRQLNANSQTIIRDFTNNVAQLVMGQRTQEGELQSTYEDAVYKISEDRLKTEYDKRKDTLQAYSTYLKDMNDVQEKRKAEEKKAMEDAYTKLKDERDYAYKVSGLYGTVYVPGENGELVDTGVPTFEARKYADQNQRDLMRLSLDARGENRQMANTLVDTYGSAASPYVEQLMGLPTGSLSGFKTKDELSRALDYYKEANEVDKWRAQEGLDVSNGKALDAYHSSGAGIKPAGIGIDPFSLTDVRENILALGSVTQSFSKPGSGHGTDTKNGGHGGVDYISKDGYSRALRGGTVVEVIPWNGNSAFGNVVRVKDSTGLVWQYAHMGNRDVEGDNPFNVQVGDEINAGDVLGREGNTGRILTAKKGNLRGRHTDVRIVGQEPTSEDYGVGGGAPGKTSDADLFAEYTKRTGKAPSQDVRAALRKGGSEALDNLTMSDDEKRDAKTFIMDLGNNWLMNAAPEEVQNAAANIQVTYKDITDAYVREFKSYPSSADQKLLEQYGLEGLKMILEREKKTVIKATPVVKIDDDN